VAPAPEMSAALAGTKAAAVMNPAAAHVVQCFAGSLHVGGQKRARGLMPVISAFAPGSGRPLLL
jgi:hypothetical protein